VYLLSVVLCTRDLTVSVDGGAQKRPCLQLAADRWSVNALMKRRLLIVRRLIATPEARGK